jgi:hypothetical protein
MRLQDLARAAAAFTLAWAAFAQLSGKSHDAIHDGDPARAWPVSRPRMHRRSCHRGRRRPASQPPSRGRQQSPPIAGTMDVF